MNLLAQLPVPLLMAGTALFALARKVDVYQAMVDGAGDGLKVLTRVFPTLVGLLSAVYMLRASGAMEAICGLLRPALRFLGIPEETALLMLVRPISGGGALAVGTDIIQSFGADSLVGRTAAVMLGSTETTFYTIAVYFGAVGIKRTRYAVPAALVADFTSFAMASLMVRLFWG